MTTQKQKVNAIIQKETETWKVAYRIYANLLQKFADKIKLELYLQNAY